MYLELIDIDDNLILRYPDVPPPQDNTRVHYNGHEYRVLGTDLHFEREQPHHRSGRIQAVYRVRVLRIDKLDP